MVKFKKKNLTKDPHKKPKIKRIKIKWEKTIYPKLGLNDKIENKSKSYKIIKNKN